MDGLNFSHNHDQFGNFRICILKQGIRLGNLEYVFYNGEAFLLNIFVESTYRNKGIGSLLLKEFEKKCEEKNISKIQGLYSPFDKIAGFNFYNKNGYKVIKNYYEKPGIKPTKHRIDILCKTFKPSSKEHTSVEEEQ